MFAKKILVIILFITALTGCGKGAEQVSIDPEPSDPTSTAARWHNQDLPLQISCPSVFNGFSTLIQNAADVWNAALGKSVFQIHFNGIPNTQWGSEFASLNDTILGLYAESNWAFSSLDNSVLAYTATETSNAQIFSADILFNAQNFQFCDVTVASSQCMDFESVLIHEMGHFLGLGHITQQTDPLSVMNPTLGYNKTKRVLSSGDLQRIKTLYSD